MKIEMRAVGAVRPYECPSPRRLARNVRPGRELAPPVRIKKSAGDRNRTCTALRPREPKSRASASSATPARRHRMDDRERGVRSAEFGMRSESRRSDFGLGIEDPDTDSDIEARDPTSMTTSTPETRSPTPDHSDPRPGTRDPKPETPLLRRPEAFFIPHNRFPRSLLPTRPAPHPYRYHRCRPFRADEEGPVPHRPSHGSRP